MTTPNEPGGCNGCGKCAACLAPDRAPSEAMLKLAREVVKEHRLCAPNSYTPQPDDPLLTERIARFGEQCRREAMEEAANEAYRIVGTRMSGAIRSLAPKAPEHPELALWKERALKARAWATGEFARENHLMREALEDIAAPDPHAPGWRQQRAQSTLDEVRNEYKEQPEHPELAGLRRAAGLCGHCDGSGDGVGEDCPACAPIRAEIARLEGERG